MFLRVCLAASIILVIGPLAGSRPQGPRHSSRWISITGSGHHIKHKNSEIIVCMPCPFPTQIMHGEVCIPQAAISCVRICRSVSQSLARYPTHHWHTYLAAPCRRLFVRPRCRSMPDRAAGQAACLLLHNADAIGLNRGRRVYLQGRQVQLRRPLRRRRSDDVENELGRAAAADQTVGAR